MRLTVGGGDGFVVGPRVCVVLFAQAVGRGFGAWDDGDRILGGDTRHGQQPGMVIRSISSHRAEARHSRAGAVPGMRLWAAGRDRFGDRPRERSGWWEATATHGNPRWVNPIE